MNRNQTGSDLSNKTTPSFSEKRNRQKAEKLVRAAQSAFDARNADAALSSAAQALALVPDFPPALVIQARVNRAIGKLPEAAMLFQTACNSPESKIEYFHELASVVGALGKLDMVQQILFAAIRRFPGHAATYSELGVVLIQGEYVNQGIEILEKAVQLDKDNWASLSNLSSALIKVGREHQAIEHLEHAKTLVANDPGRLERTLLLIGEAHRHTGDLETAKTAFRQVLGTNPHSGRAWHDLADITKFTADDADIATMADILTRDDGSLTKIDREMIGFALGKAFMDCKDPKNAIAYLDQANALRRSDFDYDPDKNQGYDSKTACARVRAIADYFPAELFEKLPQQSVDNTQPLNAFIVGMPRSGSTLTEQILGSHPGIMPTGELRSFPKFKDRLFGPTFPSQPDDHAKIGSHDLLTRLHSAYIDDVGQLYPSEDGTKVILDKMLGNFSWAGLILLSIPGAKIIHCRRNPIDTCLSCYSKRFASLQVYTCDQTELGEFYRAYEDLMTHWRAVLPKDRFIELDYEDMVANPEAEARRLLDFLDLPWDPAVLEFHKSDRSVRTASAAQVRQGMYQTSVERWKPYGPYIQPLIAALGLSAQGNEN